MKFHRSMVEFHVQGWPPPRGRNQARRCPNTYSVHTICIDRPEPRAARRALSGLTGVPTGDRKSTRLNSSHSQISYAVFCLKKKNGSQTALLATDVKIEHLTV